MRFEAATYQVEYVGLPGLRGAGTFRVDVNGTVSAWDVAGGLYRGRHEYDPETKLNTFSLVMEVPAGVTLVTDGRVRNEAELVPIQAQLRHEDLGRPVEVRTAHGPAVAIFRRTLPSAA
jgi:hypothetical protein